VISFLLNQIIDIYISDNNLQSLKIISKILKKYVSGDFFISYEIDQEFIYTPFNCYFIYNIGKIFNIFEDLTKVQMPKLFEDLISNKLPSDYEYDYFKENPDEIMNFRSILYNVDQIKSLCYTISAYQTIIFQDNNNNSNKILFAVEKLMLSKNQQIIQDITKGFSLNTKYYFLSRLEANKNYKELFNIQPEINFSIEQSQKSNLKMNIIKVKNYLFSLLNNCPNLVKTNFNEGTTDNTEKILGELYNLTELSIQKANDSIPSEWYIKTLLKYLKTLPKYLTKNDYDELYNELEKDINKLIKELDFEIFGHMWEKIKYANNKKTYYKKHFEFLEDIKYEKKVRKIAKNYFIPVDIKFMYDIDNNKNDDVQNIFRLNVSLFNEKNKNIEEKK